MVNIEITNSKTIGVVIWDPVFEDDIISYDGELPFTYLAGTILARINIGVTSGLLTVYASGNSDGSEIPVALLQNDLDLFIGNVPCRPLVAGRVRRADVIVHNSKDPITDAESDLLRDYGIIPLTTLQIAKLDN